ncbi:MAG: hypothetical protein ACKVLM_10585 [Pseudomonadales bacterium]
MGFNVSLLGCKLCIFVGFGAEFGKGIPGSAGVSFVCSELDPAFRTADTLAVVRLNNAGRAALEQQRTETPLSLAVGRL